MKTNVYEQADRKIAEVTADTVLVKTSQEALELLMGISYEHGVTKIILHQANLVAEFFDLKTGLAGDVLQKVVNYRLQLAIVGDFESVQSRSLRALIIESNFGEQIFFANTLEMAKQLLFNNEI